MEITLVSGIKSDTMEQGKLRGLPSAHFLEVREWRSKVTGDRRHKYIVLPKLRRAFTCARFGNRPQERPEQRGGRAPAPPPGHESSLHTNPPAKPLLQLRAAEEGATVTGISLRQKNPHYQVRRDTKYGERGTRAIPTAR